MNLSKYTASAADSGKRADVFISEASGLTRSHIAKLMKQGRVTLAGKAAKAKQQVREGDIFQVDIPDAQPAEVLAQDIPLDIVYQDADVAVINKARGMVVHPAPGTADGTLVNALLFALDDLSGINGEIRPGIVHRLDKNTTGLLIVAKNDEAHTYLADAIERREVKREYLALVNGKMAQDEGMVDAPIGRSKADRKLMAVVPDGRQARTHWQVEQRFADATLLRCELDTGRTHQIRVHMQHIGHPVLGDPEYGPRRQRDKAKGQLLHATRITFTHPRSQKRMQFEAPLPDDFAKRLRGLAPLDE